MTLPELLDLLKAKGVTQYSGMLDGKPVSVSIGLAEAKPGAGAKSLQFLTEPENCGCGHPAYNHNNTGCLEGCDPSKCIPAGERNKKS